MWLQVYVHACGDHRMALDVVPQQLPTLFIWDRISHIMDLMKYTKLAVSESQEFPVSTSLVLG